jgi:hypothetical protein
MPELNDTEKALGWRKRQMIYHQLEKNMRNDTLEEVAQAFERMEAFGDTAHSFAIYVRSMKNYGTEA